MQFPTVTEILKVTRNNRQYECMLLSDGTGTVFSHPISPETGKRFRARGRITHGNYDTHTKARFAWLKESRAK